MSGLVLSVRGTCGAAVSAALVRSLVRAALPDGGEVALRFVDAKKMREIHRVYCGKDSATDILSFSYHRRGGSVLGDIVICPEVAKTAAAKRRRSLSDHLAHLILHGALHLAGWRHGGRRQAEKMEECERDILSRFGIGDPYIVLAAAK